MALNKAPQKADYDYLIENLKIELFLALTARMAEGKMEESDRRLRLSLLADSAIKSALGLDIKNILGEILRPDVINP
jgi:hypothetical protein